MDLSACGLHSSCGFKVLSICYMAFDVHKSLLQILFVSFHKEGSYLIGNVGPQGRRWSDGLHQAIEAKEKVPIENETVTLASISYQNFFLQVTGLLYDCKEVELIQFAARTIA